MQQENIDEASRPIQTGRNLDHLSYDANLYEYMKSLIPFAITSTNKSLNKYLLNGDFGLEKDQFLNVYFNDSVGKRELVNELLLSAILPKEWGGYSAADESNPSQQQAEQQEDIEPKTIPEGQELGAVIFDIQGSFSSYKLLEKVRHVYQKYNLKESLAKHHQEDETKVAADLHAFIKQVFSSLHIFSCMDAIEFNLAVRSLSTFLKSNKNIGLIIVDGIHFIENQDFVSGQERKQAKQLAQGAARKEKTSVSAMAEQMIPDGDDFFGDTPASNLNEEQPQKKFFVHKKIHKSGPTRTDVKAFDMKVVERALSLLVDYQKSYNFAMIKCQARPFMRRAADLQEEVISKGLQSESVPKQFTYQQPPPPSNPSEGGDSSMANSQLPGYGQLVLEGQIQTEDEALRDRIRALFQGEVLVLRGDKHNSLVQSASGGGQNLNESLMKQHLSCLIVPHHNFARRSEVKSTYLNRYLALYVLYTCDKNLFSISDDVVKAFYI